MCNIHKIEQKEEGRKEGTRKAKEGRIDKLSGLIQNLMQASQFKIKFDSIQNSLH